jgi:ribonucleoside-triphosphate reductase
MFKNIQKRDGTIVPFNPEKIVIAVSKAGKSTGEFDDSIARQLALKVVAIAENTLKIDAPHIEDIQDIVEEVLLNSTYKKTAKAYVIYRDQHRVIREITDQSTVDLVDGYLAKLDWKVNENSNMSFSLQGLNNYVISQISERYWLNKIYSQDIKNAHEKGQLHIHDLNVIAVYCCGWDLYDLLQVGFCGVPGKVESNPPKHFRTALGQLVNFFYTIQGEAAGAVAFSNFDTLLAPFIYYDKLSRDEVRQALQEFLFNMNVPTRVGFQTPFTNVTMDLVVPATFAKQPVIIGGQFQDKTYSEFQNELNMFNEVFLELMVKGDAKGRVFSFPIPTYNITKDFDWENPSHNGLWEISAKYGIPYFSNFVNSDLSPEDARSMCCRLRLDNTKLQVRGGGLFGSHPLTGSIGVVTLNLPRIGYLAKNEQEFVQEVERLMLIAKESLETKRKVLERITEHNLYPYTKFYLRHIKKQSGQYWKNHFSTIGLVGMNEASLNLLGEGISEKRGYEFAQFVLDFMRNKLVEFQQETGNNYNLEATPAEGTTYRLALKDKQAFPDILCANEECLAQGAAPFYTNSTHFPVNFTDDLFGMLDKQDLLQTKYTGGTVVHLFLGERVHDALVVRELVKTICSKYKLPYFTFTPTFSICPSHGYLAGEHHTCQTCSASCEVFSRVVGYIRPVSQWNKGKQSEYAIRKLFVVPDVEIEKLGLQASACPAEKENK